MVLADRNSETVRNGRRSRGPSPNGHASDSSSEEEAEEKIRVGRDYQAVVPELIPAPDRRPEQCAERALLVWSPTAEIPDYKLDEYISLAKEKYGYNGEQALGMLFWHKHDLERAILVLGVPSEPSLNEEFNFFLRGREGMLTQRPPTMEGLNNEQLEALFRLSTRLPAFKNLAMRIQEMPELSAWLQQSTPEQCVPQLWQEEKPLSTIGTAMYQLLLIQAFRADRVIAAGQQLVAAVLGPDFMPAAEKELDLPSIVENEVTASVPALLCWVPGFDASGRVDDLAAELGRPLVGIAIRSAEGFSQADRAINLAVKSGRWVLLKNVHLAPQWLVQLEKKLHSLQPHAAFRLFLTMEINPKVPVNLLRAGRIFVFEPPPGIRANLLRTFSTIKRHPRSAESSIHHKDN